MVAERGTSPVIAISITEESASAAARAAMQKLRADLACSQRECADWKAKAERLAAEMERRDRNEDRNCINWGPCSRHDAHMEDVSR